MPSNRGGTDPGSSCTTPTSSRTLPGCWTCTPAPTRVGDCVRMSTCSPRTGGPSRSRGQNPRFRPVTAATAPHRPVPGRRCGGSRLPPWRCAGVSRRLRRAPGDGVRPVRVLHRYRAVHRSGRSGHDTRAVRVGPARVLRLSTTVPRTVGRPRSIGGRSGIRTR